MDYTQHFIQIDQYTINVDRIDYIERSEEWSTVIHFTGGRSLHLSEDSAVVFFQKMGNLADDPPSWADRAENPKRSSFPS